MAAKHKPEIVVHKQLHAGKDPAYLALGHRHLEKECPTGQKVGRFVEFNVPTDLLGMILSLDLVEEIVEVTFGYRAKP